MVWNATGDLDEAIAAFRKAIALKPNYAEAHSNLGNLLQEKGQLGQAIAACRRAIAFKPDLAQAHSNLGNALEDKGQLTRPSPLIARPSPSIPTTPEAHNNLGNALSYKGQPEEAIACYRQAIALKPDLAEAHFNLARILQSARPDESARNMSRRCSFAPMPSHGGLNWPRSAATIPCPPPRPNTSAACSTLSLRTFERHLVQGLRYRVPEGLLAAVLAAVPGRLFDVLDLGCGTGICGVLIKLYARRLAGVDLSPRMIQAANPGKSTTISPLPTSSCRSANTWPATT